MLRKRLRRVGHGGGQRHDVTAATLLACSLVPPLRRLLLLLLLLLLAGGHPEAGGERLDRLGDDAAQLARHAAAQRRLRLLQPAQLRNAVHQRCRAGKGRLCTEGAVLIALEHNHSYMQIPPTHPKHTHHTPVSGSCVSTRWPSMAVSPGDPGISPPSV